MYDNYAIVTILFRVSSVNLSPMLVYISMIMCMCIASEQLLTALQCAWRIDELKYDGRYGD